MRELFVYYRAEPAQAPALSGAVQAAQAGLRADWPGLEARLLRRPEPAADGRETWMEAYRRPPGGVDASLEAAIEARLGAVLAALPGRPPGPRHAERFDPAGPAGPGPCA